MGSQNSDAKIPVDSIYKKINNINPVNKPVFVDSTGTQNQTYSYRVSVITKNSTESVKSDEVLVHIATYLSLDTIFSNNSIARVKSQGLNRFLYKNGLFYMVADSGIRVLDTLCNQIGMWGSIRNRPFEIAGDNSGRIYLACADTLTSIMSIYVFNPNGTLAKRINIKDTLDSIPSIGIDVTLFTVSNNGNIIFVKSDRDSIYICDTAGSIIRKIGGFFSRSPSGSPQEYITSIVTDQNNKLYVYKYSQDIKVFDAEGAFIRTVQTRSQIPYLNSISVDPRNGNIFYSNGTSLLVCSSEGNPITDYSIANGNLENLIVTGNKIYFSNEQILYDGDNRYIGFKSNIIKLTNKLP
jgi:hypothetical protein